MIYLEQKDIQEIGIDWNVLSNHIEEAVKCLSKDDFAQPIKPYLRYRNLENRIIAMPAFLGEGFNMAGIKWIASFPKNIHKNIPRAHSVLILNNSETGEPVCIINTAILSVIRTASVSALMIKHFIKVRKIENINIGIIGWGPIGQYHHKMCQAILGDRLSSTYLYDLQKIDISQVQARENENIHIANKWEEVYNNSDILMTCTVSAAPYINKPPKDGSLILNVSLRDFTTDVYDYVKDSIIVDNWEEVCRENTDIENMHKRKGLNKEDTKSIIDVVENNCLKDYDANAPIMFNPMGMAVFDIAIATSYYQEALKRNMQLKR